MNQRELDQLMALLELLATSLNLSQEHLKEDHRMMREEVEENPELGESDAYLSYDNSMQTRMRVNEEVLKKAEELMGIPGRYTDPEFQLPNGVTMITPPSSVDVRVQVTHDVDTNLVNITFDQPVMNMAMDLDEIREFKYSIVEGMERLALLSGRARMN